MKRPRPSLLLVMLCCHRPALLQSGDRPANAETMSSLAPSGVDDEQRAGRYLAPRPAQPAPATLPPAAPVKPAETPGGTCDLPDTAEEAPLFASNEAALRKRGTQILDGVVACYEAGLYRGLQLVLTGYSDPRGSEEYNRSLALARARAVRRYLIRRGLPVERIEIASAGEEYYRGSGPESWMYDRRVEITSRPARGQSPAREGTYLEADASPTLPSPAP